MAPSAFHEARLDVRVERDLRVTLTPRAPAVGPGGEVEVEVTTTDQNGKPAAAELSIALVDRSLLRLFRDRLPTIDRFFYDQSRTSAFAAQSTHTFRYQPATVPVPEAVVEDAAQQAAQLADAQGRVEVLSRAGAVASAPVNLPQAAPPPAPAMGGMMGGMGARGKAECTAPARAYMALGAGARDAEGEIAKEKLGEDLAADAPVVWAYSKDGRTQHFSEDTTVSPIAPGRSLREGGRNASAPPRGSGSSRRPTGTLRSSPARTARPSSSSGAPAALSEYRFTARGVSGRDTLVGQATADLAVRKDFFVDLKVPSAVTQGDKPRFSAEVHHRGVVGTLALRLTIYAGGRESVDPRRIEVKADGVEQVLFDPFDVPDGDEVRLTLAATLGEAKDEMTVAVPIRPWGVQAFASASGSADDDTTAFVALPPGRRYEQPEMLVVISPTVRRMLVELALGEDAYLLKARSKTCIPEPPSTIADRAGDLLAAGAGDGLPPIDPGDGFARRRCD